MTVQSWRTLRTKKYQLSLRLFLLLNAVSALFTLVFPLFAVKSVSVPALLILAASTLLFVWHGKYANKRINLPFISIIFGLLWAAHIVLKFTTLGNNDYYFLLIALLSVRYIRYPQSSSVYGLTVASMVCEFSILWRCPWPVLPFNT